MVRQVALFVLWAAIGLALSLELVLYLFTPIGLAVGVPLFALIWWLEGRGLSRQPGGWGALVGPGLFCLLVVANADSGAEGWAIAGGMAIGLAVTGFMVTGRRRCA